MNKKHYSQSNFTVNLVSTKIKTTRYGLGCLEVGKSLFFILKHPSLLYPV